MTSRNLPKTKPGYEEHADELSIQMSISEHRVNLMSRIIDLIYKRVTILQWLPKYNRVDLISDCIAGITVGLTMVPQSIAYASIAEVPAHIGLYTAIMGTFMYIFFGTIKEVSIGPSSLMTLMTYSYTRDLPIEYVHLLCLMAGCVEFLMGVLNLGFLVSFISVPVTSGFTSASALIIIFAQLKNLFGIKFRSQGTIEFISEFFKHIGEYRFYDTILGFSCMVFLLGFKHLGKLQVKNPKLKKTLWFLSICRNALVVIISTIMAGMLDRVVHLRNAGAVRPGLPTFKIPSFSTTYHNETVPFTEMVSTLGSGILVVPIVAILANVAISKSFSGGKTVDATQEMMTLGICNVMGSCVGAMPTTGAFTRSAVNNSSGVRTPMGGLYAGTIILLALSFLTPYFYYIPKATLAGVLISAVLSMIEYEILPLLWRTNKLDFVIALTTFFASVFNGVEVGLCVGVLMNMISLIKVWVKPKISAATYSVSKGYEYLNITPEFGLLFPASDYFRDEIIRLTEQSEIPIALDFQFVLSIDSTACKCIESLMKIFKDKPQQFFFVNIVPKVLNPLKAYTDMSNILIVERSVDICHDVFDQLNNATEVTTPLLPISNEYFGDKPRKSSVFDNPA